MSPFGVMLGMLLPSPGTAHCVNQSRPSQSPVCQNNAPEAQCKPFPSLPRPPQRSLLHPPALATRITLSHGNRAPTGATERSPSKNSSMTSLAILDTWSRASSHLHCVGELLQRACLECQTVPKSANLVHRRPSPRTPEKCRFLRFKRRASQ